MGSRKSIASLAGLLLGAGVLALAGATPAAAEELQGAATPTTISGVAQVGQTLTATSAVWKWEYGRLQMFSNDYTWDRCTSPSVSDCTIILLSPDYLTAESPSDKWHYWTSWKYEVTAGDVGSMIRSVSGIHGNWGSAWSWSAPTAVVTTAPTTPPPPPTKPVPPTTPTTPTPTKPANTALPKIKGKAKVNNKLTVSSGTWTGTAPIAYKYQWKSCNVKVKKCQAIRGATKNSLRISLKYRGRHLVVAVTATNTAGRTTVTSKATSVIVK